jgi:hypothetical protein
VLPVLIAVMVDVMERTLFWLLSEGILIAKGYSCTKGVNRDGFKVFDADGDTC